MDRHMGTGDELSGVLALNLGIAVVDGLARLDAVGTPRALVDKDPVDPGVRHVFQGPLRVLHPGIGDGKPLEPEKIIDLVCLFSKGDSRRGKIMMVGIDDDSLGHGLRSSVRNRLGHL